MTMVSWTHMWRVYLPLTLDSSRTGSIPIAPLSDTNRQLAGERVGQQEVTSGNCFKGRTHGNRPIMLQMEVTVEMGMTLVVLGR